MLGGKRGQKSSMWDFFDKLEIQFAHKGELDFINLTFYLRIFKPLNSFLIGIHLQESRSLANR